MMRLPETVRTVISRTEGLWSEHAAEDAERLSLTWSDIVAIAETAASCKKQRDPRMAGNYVFSVVGSDRRGRLLYMAGKVVHYEEEHRWKVVTVHEAD